MSVATITYSHDGYLRTPCPSWCHTDSCDGTVHSSAPAYVDKPEITDGLALNVEQYADEAEPYISLEDACARRQDKFTADQAERLAHALLDQAKILRAHAVGAGR